MKNSLILIFVLILSFGGFVVAENVPPRTPGGFPKILDDDKWSSQILYDTIGACYQGTIRWIVLTHPALGNQVPNPLAQRKEIEYRDYIKKVTDMNWTGNFFMTKAIECVGEYQTLPSFFTNILIPTDNKTKDNKTTIPDVPQDSPEEPQSQKPIESTEDTGTIFQG